MTSTYVNDLRLNEMATGDQSGSWGTVTNTNLELIAEAFSYGTEAITTNADTHTTTIADGATDPGRSMFLKYTGTLDSTCTITIGPNTVSKLWFIENATSGSQDIIIKQGSGATVTIASGKTKVIYSDGVGSGAKMVDAFAALDVGSVSVDNITIDGTTISNSSGDLTIDVAGDISLDADGADINLKDGGTRFGILYQSSNNFHIESGIADQDIKFLGTDGSSQITALQLDMSDAGTAIFNHDIKLDDNSEIVFGADGDLKIFCDNSGNYIRSQTSNMDLNVVVNDGGNIITALSFDASDAGTAIFNHDAQFPDGAQVRLGADNDLKLHLSGTTAIFGAQNGDMLLDSAGDIELDAGGGDFIFKDDGTSIFLINHSSSDVQLTSMVNNKDIIFRGNDGGSFITALTLDMSDAGHAKFNSSVSLVDNAKLNIGTGSDLQIYHDGSNSIILDQGVGNLHIRATNFNLLNADGNENYMSANDNGNVNLYYDNSIKLSTSSSGVTVTGTVAATSYTGDGSNLTGVGGGASVQEFTSSGTWNKPSSGTVAMITCIGGGGGGAKNNANIGNTYSVGGSMQVKWILLSDLPSSVTVTIGAGGALGYQSSAGAGGHTTFGTEALGSGGQGAEAYWSTFYSINYPSGTPYNANIHDGFLSGNQQPVRRAGDGTIRPQVAGNSSSSNINLSIVSGQTGTNSPYSYFMSQGAGGFAPHGGSTQTAQVGYDSDGS